MSASKPFTISRTFNAPRAVVFKAWTDLGALKKWFGPKGMPVTKATLDLKPGGTFHYNMETPGGEMWGLWVFREISPIDRLIFVSSFSDPAGGVTRAPFPGDFPRELLSTVTFTDAADGKTTVTMQGSPLDATEAERSFFEGMFGSMTGGWTGTLDQLEAYLTMK